jgi:hypothetical protein
VKGILVVLTAFVLLPGSVFMLLAANFGALKGYMIAATAFFGFLALLSAVWLFGLPGTTPLTGRRRRPARPPARRPAAHRRPCGPTSTWPGRPPSAS